MLRSGRFIGSRKKQNGLGENADGEPGKHQQQAQVIPGAQEGITRVGHVKSKELMRASAYPEGDGDQQDAKDEDASTDGAFGSELHALARRTATRWVGQETWSDSHEPGKEGNGGKGASML